MRRRDFLATSAAATTLALARPAVAQAQKPLRFVPQANLANPDPIWTTATVAINHGYMVWDTLYGVDNALTSRPQMVAGHDVSSDELTWTFTLRDGLLFHDNVPVRGIDCTTSINRWAQKDPFGARLTALTDEMKPLDDKRFQIRLKKPFRQMLYALGAENCMIMPERMAKTPASTQVSEFIGSGPFVFKRDEWVSGVKAVYTKFDKYVSRQEKSEYFSGGKPVYFDRVEWIIQPDPSTAANALTTGEVDWVEQVLIDLVPMLNSAPGVRAASFDPLGVLAMMVPNHLYPPFDNPAILRAVISAVNQTEFVEAVVGDQKDLASLPAGFFTVGAPMSNQAGIEALTSPRNLAAAKQAIQAAGYKGEPVALMSPSDQPALTAIAQVTRDLLTKLGINVDYQVMDWGTLVSRRTKQDPPSAGGWNMFCTTWGGLAVANPGSSYPLQSTGKKGWFGWYDNPKILALKDDWFNAPDVAAQKKICEDIQREAFQNPPVVPVGQWKQPNAWRQDLTGFVECPNILFWGVHRT